MTTVFTFVPSPNHEYPDHPERPGRLDLLEPMLDSFGAERIEPVRATVEEIARVHQPKMIREIEDVCKQGSGIIDYAPTYVTETSYEDALLAAGGVITCARAVLKGEAQNAFAIVRPPGHHAEPHRAMGFCIFSNIAIAAQDALAHGLERVMVIDFDAHHGNGTQAAFLNDERTGFISTHQWGIYPGTGWIEDTPHARGRLVNVPLHAHAGDETHARICDAIFKPVVEAFRPQMLFVSAGFDAHWSDPLTSLGLSTQGYYMMSKKLVEIAEKYCGGKIVFVLEGGYDPRNVAHGAAAVFGALTNSGLRVEAADSSPYPDPDHESRIREILKWNGIAQ
ncbi:MAG TPA: histone deacetylase [Anaerolineales bacterium]|nr:histone deacetylase [Anaerolineales bacterium]